MRYVPLILLCAFLFSTASATAHSGHKEKEPETITSDDDGLSSPFSKSDIFSDDDDMMDMGASGMEEMDSAGHGQHTMPEVEIAHHELVSSSKSGYGVAIGFTIFAGLVFGFLTIKRPFE